MDQIKLYNILRNALKMSDQDAGEFISAMGAITTKEIDSKIQTLATKEDLKDLKVDLHNKIYTVSLVQFLALVASMLAIVKFMR